MFKNQTGNALFLILIAVALFAALSYAITQSSRSSASIEREKQMIAQAVSEQCNASVEYAVKKLQMIGGCSASDINYEINDNVSTDKSCHVFEPAGGGVSPCGAYLAEYNCDLEALAIGEKCEGADLIYAGTSGGNRLYTTAADQGRFWWSQTSWVTTGATSNSNGLANTNTLVNLSDGGTAYEAALACRGLGNDWYLPARDELNVLYTNRIAIGGFNLIEAFPYGWYWSSSESMSNGARAQKFSDGGTQYTEHKGNYLFVRCVRR